MNGAATAAFQQLYNNESQRMAESFGLPNATGVKYLHYQQKWDGMMSALSRFARIQPILDRFSAKTGFVVANGLGLDGSAAINGAGESALKADLVLGEGAAAYAALKYMVYGSPRQSSNFDIDIAVGSAVGLVATIGFTDNSIQWSVGAAYVGGSMGKVGFESGSSSGIASQMLSRPTPEVGPVLQNLIPMIRSEYGY